MTTREMPKNPSRHRVRRAVQAEPAIAQTEPALDPIAPAPRNVSDLPLQLDKVNFRLHKLTNLMSRPFFGQFAKEHALSLTEWRCIVVLAHRPGSAAQDLCEHLGSLPMSVSRAMSTLRQRALVEEARDPDNHRRVLLWLAEGGWDLFRRIAPHAETNNRALFGILEPQELAQFMQTLEKLTAQAERVTCGPYEDAEDTGTF